jgi:putative ABC transport system permease protein
MARMLERLAPRWRKVTRDAWLHKSRTLLVVAAICVGIIGAGSVLDAWSLLRRVTRDEYKASNAASATLRTDSIDAGLLRQVRAIPEIADAEARRTLVASARTSTGWRTAMIFATNDFAKRIGRLKPESGAWPPNDGAIVLEASSVEFAGLGVGDTLAVQLGEGSPSHLPIAGVARDVGLAPGWMEHVVYGFATPATLARLGASPSLNELQIVVRDRSMSREGVRRVAARATAVIERSGRRVTDVDVPVPGRHIHAGQIDSLLYTQGAFGLLALALSGILVINLISAMLAGQVREIGIMKAIGARGRQIAAMYLGFAFVLGLIACAISLPLAWLIGRGYARFTADILNFDVSGFTVPAWAFAIQLSAGSLLPVAAAAIPVLRGTRISVGEALRDLGIPVRIESGASRLLGSVAGVTRPTLLSLRNAFRKRQRLALTLLTLSSGGAVYVGALNLRTAIVGSVDLLFAAQRYDLAMRLARTYRGDSLVGLVTRVPGVTRAEAWRVARAAIVRGDGLPGTSFAVTGPPLNSSMSGPAIAGGREIQPGDRNALVVNKRLVDDDSTLAIGSRVTLVVAGREAQWTIVGIANAGPSPVAFASREALSAAMDNGDASAGDANVIVVASDSRSPAAQLDLIQRVRRDLTDAGVEVSSGQLVVQQRKVIEDHLLMVGGFLGIMAQLIIVVGGLGLASTMSLAVLERTREIGVLRAIGARHRAILAMVQIEGLVVAVLSWIIALPLSVPMSVALGRAFGRIMLPVPVILLPDSAAVIRWLIVVVVVSIVACAWPAYRAMRVTTRAALSYE